MTQHPWQACARGGQLIWMREGSELNRIPVDLGVVAKAAMLEWRHVASVFNTG